MSQSFQARFSTVFIPQFNCRSTFKEKSISRPRQAAKPALKISRKVQSQAARFTNIIARHMLY